MIHLINKALFDARSTISANYSWERLTPIVELVQFRYIQDICGTDLYVALQTKVQAYMANQTAIAAAYKTLLDDYIVPCMVQHIQAEMALSAKFRVTPAGIVEAAPDNANPIATEDLKWFIDECRNNAESYGKRAIDHIIQYASSFPEYSTNTGMDKTQPAATTFQSPIYTRRRRRYFRNDEGPLHD